MKISLKKIVIPGILLVSCFSQNADAMQMFSRGSRVFGGHLSGNHMQHRPNIRCYVSKVLPESEWDPNLHRIRFDPILATRFDLPPEPIDTHDSVYISFNGNCSRANIYSKGSGKNINVDYYDFCNASLGGDGSQPIYIYTLDHEKNRFTYQKLEKIDAGKSGPNDPTE